MERYPKGRYMRAREEPVQPLRSVQPTKQRKFRVWLELPFVVMYCFVIYFVGLLAGLHFASAALPTRFRPGDHVVTGDGRHGQIAQWSYSTSVDHWYNIEFQNNGVAYQEQFRHCKLKK